MDKPVTNSERRPMLLLEQKPVAVVQHIPRKFFRLVAMDFDPCMRIGATAEACLVEPQHRKFTGCDSNGACVERMIPSLLETFERQILNGNSERVENADVKTVARLYL